MALAICAATLFDVSAQEQEIRLFSHRGGRMEHDENTLSAFQASYDAGYRGFETDIRMTADGALVVTHDSSLERTTNGSGTVEEKTEAEIRQLVTKQGNKMMFLDELLDFLKGKEGLYVEFEMKTKPEELYPEARLHEYCDKLYKAVKAIQPDDALFVFLDPLCILDRSWNARAQRIDEFVDFSFVEDDLVFIEQWLLCVFCHEGEFVD